HDSMDFFFFFFFFFVVYCKQDIFIFYIQWLIFLLIGNTMKNTMLRKGLTIF
ncbi:replication protein RepC, partial [Salmonella enterica subsp. enterica serovar Newport str. SHSN010]